MPVVLSEPVDSVGRADFVPLVAQIVQPQGIADSHECVPDRDSALKFLSI